MAIIENLKIDKGTTWSRGFLMQDDLGLPLVDGWVVSAVVKDSSDGSILFTLDSVITGGVLILSVLPTVSALWTWTHGVYDVRISKDGLVERVLTGQVFVR